MTPTPRCTFYESQHLGLPGSLEAIIDSLQDQRYSIYHLYFGSFLGEEPSYSKPDQDQIDNELIPMAYKKMQLNLAVAEVEPVYFSLYVRMKWEPGEGRQHAKQMFRIEVSHDSRALMSRHEYNPLYFTRRFIDISKEMYNVLAPSYGWMDRCRTHGYTTEADVDALSVPHLYWGNFFGPDYVEALGEEFLMNTPAGTSEKLDDGGIVYTLNSLMSRTAPRRKAETEAKEYFGL